MLENVEVLCHSSIRINKEKTIYIDPFKIDRNFNDADICMILENWLDNSIEAVSRIYEINKREIDIEAR